MFLEGILQSDKVRELEQALQSQETVLIENLWNAPKAFVSALAQKATGKHVLILTGASQEEVRLFHDFSAFTECPVLDFPSWETLPSENIPPSPDIVGERYQVLRQIATSSHPYIILSNLQACLQKLIPPEAFKTLYLTLKQGETFAFDQLIEKLIEMGYQRRPLATDKGEFAVRGGIIDIFPVSSPDPYRLEFWGDELDSLRIYDPIGQKSVKAAQEVQIPPAQELELLSKKGDDVSILDYLGPNTIVIFDDLLALEDRYASLVNLGSSSSKVFSSIEDFLDKVTALQAIYWTQTPIDELSEVHSLEKSSGGYYSMQQTFHRLSFQMFNRNFEAKRWNHPFLTIEEYLVSENPEASADEILHALSREVNKNCHLHFLCGSEAEEASLHKRLLDAKIAIPHHTQMHIGYLSGGMALRDIHYVLLPLTELTHRYKIRRQKQRSTYHTAPLEVFDLSPGEMIVHLNNGIGKYLGMEKRPNHLGIAAEFLVVEYAEAAKLYVPINQAHLITKYIGSGEVIPRMHTLGGQRWKKSKEQTELAIMGYASDLLQLYAKRAMKEGFAYPEDSPDLLAFEEDFPFVETEDQLSAIASIKRDMISGKAMDRLICGDVGYGKTEVAMRAAFKAVIDGKQQVAVLVPTTVLAMQHYENFVERMANFPINVGVLSRFRSAKEIRETLEGVAKGSVDILIGTHRIISEDVVFKQLGLVIVDEEQRFGVRAKEHLKKIKVGVDCLTLSATPIPRTLYMSLVGARDMSVISTPPQDRLPIKTIVAESHDQIIKKCPVA